MQKMFCEDALLKLFVGDPWRTVREMNDAAACKSVFCNDVLHDLIVMMRVDAKMGDLRFTEGEDLSEEAMDRAVTGDKMDHAVGLCGEPVSVFDLRIGGILFYGKIKGAVNLSVRIRKDILLLRMDVLQKKCGVRKAVHPLKRVAVLCHKGAGGCINIQNN